MPIENAEVEAVITESAPLGPKAQCRATGQGLAKATAISCVNTPLRDYA